MYASLTRCFVAGLAAWLVVGGNVAVEGFQAGPGGTSNPDYQGTAVIVGLHPPFIAASTELFEGLEPGDHVEFGLKVTADALLVISLRRAAARRPGP